MICAICTGDHPPFSTEPLGKNDAPVLVCSRCTGEPAREKPPHDHFLYEPPVITSNFRNAVDAAHRRVVRGRDYLDPRGVVVADIHSGRTPNTILVKVRRRNGSGRAKDLRDCLATFCDEPWAKEVRYLGSNHTFHLFERPDPKFAAKSRARDVDVVGELEQLARGK